MNSWGREGAREGKVAGKWGGYACICAKGREDGEMNTWETGLGAAEGCVKGVVCVYVWGAWVVVLGRAWMRCPSRVTVRCGKDAAEGVRGAVGTAGAVGPGRGQRVPAVCCVILLPPGSRWRVGPEDSRARRQSPHEAPGSGGQGSERGPPSCPDARPAAA